MAKAKKKNKKPIDELDRLFHEKARLSILTAVIPYGDGVNFNDLKVVCGLTDGNLNRHLKVLLDAGILSVAKSGSGRTTNSVYSLTDLGRTAFENYLDALESVVKTAQLAAQKTASQVNVAME